MFDDSEEFKIIKTITIPGQLISKKNNMQANIICERATIGHKKVWREYEKAALAYLSTIKPIPLKHFENGPIYMHIWNYRRDKRAYDDNNLAQGIADVLQGDLKCKIKQLRHAIIPEDDMNHLKIVFESPFAGWSISKSSPRTVLTFTSDPYYLEPEHLTKEGIIKLIEESNRRQNEN